MFDEGDQRDFYLYEYWFHRKNPQNIVRMNSQLHSKVKMKVYDLAFNFLISTNFKELDLITSDETEDFIDKQNREIVIDES